MSMVRKKDLVKYYKEIEKSIMGSKEEKRKILKILHNDVEDFMDQNPDATVETIRGHFGDPALFAQESISYITPKEVGRFTRKHRRALIVAGVLAVVVAVSVFILFMSSFVTPGVMKESPAYKTPDNSSAIVEVY